jgi:dihydroxyacetone kinase-like protein
MLDTLIPVAETFSRLAGQDTEPAQIFDALKQAALQGMQSTKDMVATRGRAAGLGERSIGHIDAGAKSSQVMINAVCDLALTQD